MSDHDHVWMQRALAEARRGCGFVEPNPMVGAVVIQQGRVVGVGHHRRFGGPHAEVHALAEAGEAGRGATLYVTLEPCCHHGKTPPCTEAILRAGIARVVVAMADPFPKVAGGGLRMLRDAGLEVAVGIGEVEARRLNAPFLKRVLTGRAFVIAKWAMTLDGKMACANGDSRWISNATSRSRVHERRGLVDGILVGIGTALADDPELTARPPGPRTPLRIVLDNAARLPASSRLAQTAREIPTLIVTDERTKPSARFELLDLGCDFLELPGRGVERIRQLLEHLETRGVTNLLVEGGGRVLGSFRDADEIDAVDIYLAPKLEGGPPVHIPLQGRGLERMADASRLENVVIEQLDGDLHVTGLVPKPWLRPESSISPFATPNTTLEKDPVQFGPGAIR